MGKGRGAGQEVAQGSRRICAKERGDSAWENRYRKRDLLHSGQCCRRCAAQQVDLALLNIAEAVGDHHRHPFHRQRREPEFGLQLISDFLAQHHRVSSGSAGRVAIRKRLSISSITEGELAGCLHPIECSCRGRPGGYCRKQRSSEQADRGESKPKPGPVLFLFECGAHIMSPLAIAAHHNHAAFSRSLITSSVEVKRGAIKPQITKLSAVTSMPPS